MIDAIDIAARLRDPARGWHPDQIEAAAEILRLRSELEAAKKDAAQVQALLPGSYYMDPPDGGSVTVLERLQRMAKDAGRYRFLRDARLDGDEEERPTIRAADNDPYHWALRGAEADAAIDAEMAKE